MKKFSLKMSAILCCLAGCVNLALANPAYMSSSSAPPSSTTVDYNQAPPSGYASSSSMAPPSTTVEQHHTHRNHGSIHVNVSNSDSYASYQFGTRHHNGNHSPQPFWIHMHYGEAIPTNAIVGGSQDNTNAMFYVCRANYQGGVHPGKLVSGNCSISWGGRELFMRDYEVLLSDYPLQWAEGNYGTIPHHAIEGGYEHHRKLYICQTDYKNGTHLGKVIGNNCNFGYRGHELMSPYYSVLIR
jgi:hypothetical protein